MKPALHIDWATTEGARFACEHWHYSGCLPMPPLVKVGVWEDSRFIGVVLFSRGASPKLLARYGLHQGQGCELTRVALTAHRTPVSRIVAIAVKFLVKHSPGLRLVVSFADPNAGHHGGIYQAGGWIYSGTSAQKTDYLGPDGKLYLSRQVAESGVVMQFGKLTRTHKRSSCTPVVMAPKHRYLLPLDHDMRAAVASLAKPYPKRPQSPNAHESSRLPVPPALGGDDADPCAPSREGRTADVTQTS